MTGTFCFLILSLAAEGGAVPAKVPFRELLERALRNDPERAVAEAERDGAEAAIDLARWTRWSPRVIGTGSFGVVPGARGSIVASPDTPRDLDNFGPFWRSRFDLSFPIVTFGRLTNAARAAKTALASREARLSGRYAVMAELSARAYFGYLLAERNLALLDEVRARLASHAAKVEADENADPTDVYRVRGYSFHLDRLTAEARRGLQEASLGLELLAGGPVRPEKAELQPLVQDETLSADEDVEKALATSPELREAELGAEAKSLLARSEREDRPVISLEGRFEYGRAPGRAPQENPFVYDAFNVRSLGASFGVRWDMNFKQTGAKTARALAEAEVARAKSAALRMRLRLELGRTRARLEEAREVHETSRRAIGTAVSWLRLAEENQGLGTAGMNDVIDAYAAYLQARSSQLRAVHDLNLALVAWRTALGQNVPEEAP